MDVNEVTTNMAQQTQEFGPPLMDPQMSISSIRHLGLTTTDAVEELVDNSLDAGAKEIHVDLVTDGGKASIIVSDNGKGISPNEIPKVLAFGGRGTNVSSEPIGRFGWGLSSAIVCQTTYGELFSRQESGKWYQGFIDLKTLINNPGGRLQKERQASLEELPKGQPWQSGSGTIVVLHDCDRLEFKQLKTLEDHLRRELGEVYRLFLHRGVRIFLNGKELEVIDPLLRLSTAKHVRRAGPPKYEWNPEPIVFDQIMDPLTGLPAKVTMKVVWLDAYKVYADKDRTGLVSALDIGMDSQGFYMMRHDRQIRGGQALRLFTKNPSLNYMRGEISWPPVLDEYFGVQTNKGRFSLEDSLRDKLRIRLEPVKAQVTAMWKEYSAWSKKQKTSTGVEKATEVVARVDSKLKPNAEVGTPEQREAANAARIETLEKEKQEVLSDDNLSPNQKKHRMKELENKAQFKGPFDWGLEQHESGDFYSIHPAGDITEIRWNTAHPFYPLILERAIESGLDAPIKLLIAAMVKAELIHYGSKDIRQFYKIQRREWSTILDAYLMELQELGDDAPDGDE